jgi:Skp family chaperone for outer membrane proteins
MSFLVLGATCAYSKELKIGYVDPVKILNEYKKTKDSEKSFDEKRKGKEAARKAMVDEITKLKDEQALLSDKAKADKQGAIDAKVKALQEFDKKTREELMTEGNDILAGIQKDIEKVVTDYCKENGYDLVLNSRVLLYGQPTMDFTDEILKRLNK